MMSFMPTLMQTLRMARLLTILLVPALAACGQSQSQPQASSPPPQVTIAKPVSKMVADQDEYVGRFVAVESVEVRARVPGYLEAIHFQDGQMVKEGDVLFTIDLQFTELRAPVAGRIGDRRVSIGNLVTGGTSGNTSLLATIESVDPIRFEFTLDEASYLRYGHFAEAGAAATNRGLTLPV